jgi:hypothetical protein
MRKMERITVKTPVGRFKETLNKWLRGRITALRGARNLNIFLYMPRFLRSVRLVLHPAQPFIQHFLNGNTFQKITPDCSLYLQEYRTYPDRAAIFQ